MERDAVKRSMAGVALALGLAALLPLTSLAQQQKSQEAEAQVNQRIGERIQGTLEQVRAAYSAADKSLSASVEAVSAANVTEQQAEKAIDEVLKTINGMLDQLKDDSSLMREIAQLIERVGDGQKEYLELYKQTRNEGFRQIAAAFETIQRGLMADREGIVNERVTARDLRERFSTERKLTVGWIRVGQAEKARESLGEFRKNLADANKKMAEHLVSVEQAAKRAVSTR